MLYPDKAHVSCVECMHNVTRVDSNICRRNYIFEGQVRTPVKRIGDLWYTKVRVLDNFKTGEIAITKKGSYAMTKVFLKCNLCPKLERRKTYIFTGRELHAYTKRGSSFLYAKVSQSDYILPRIRKRFTGKNWKCNSRLFSSFAHYWGSALFRKVFFPNQLSTLFSAGFDRKSCSYIEESVKLGATGISNE